ncbi:serpin B [Streptacidiphilus sp. MAP12-16]|uniref:serpin family protein n=1 Tax=Streptacidiphilus sp. MAP12-16 TaxID=3156300 RepID=UPI003517BC72
MRGRIAVGLAAAGVLVGAAVYASPLGAEPAADTTLIRLTAPAAPPPVTAVERMDAARSSTVLGLDLLHSLAAPGAGGAPGNLTLSPSSLATALAMLLPGTRGATRTEITRMLHTTLTPEQYAQAVGALDRAEQAASKADHTTLEQADTLWVQQGYRIQQPYLGTLASAFDTGVRTTDFGRDPDGARRAVNQLVDQQTHGAVKELLGQGSVDGLTRLVLTDALYLHAAWAEPFAKPETAPAPFHLQSGRTVTAQLMHRTQPVPYAAVPGWQAVELPYQGGHLAMDLLLPDSGDFSGRSAALTAPVLDGLLGGLQRTRLDLSVPRFGFDYGGRLDSVLQGMGMRTAFTNAADLGGIPANGEALHLAEVAQRTRVAVTEDGTTAAAATGIVGEATSAQAAPGRSLSFDRPFLFLIRDVTDGRTLFLGQVTDPGA